MKLQKEVWLGANKNTCKENKNDAMSRTLVSLAEAIIALCLLRVLELMDNPGRGISVVNKV